MVTRLNPSKPVVRRIGPKLVVRITAAGIEIRGKHKHQWHGIPWKRLAWLLTDEAERVGDLVYLAEVEAGEEILAKIGAIE